MIRLDTIEDVDARTAKNTLKLTLIKLNKGI